VAIYLALPRLLDAAKFRSWAFRIARDRIYREYRRRKLPVQSADDAQLAEVPEPAELNSTIDRQELHRCLEMISPEHREALVLRFFEEMSYEDIAHATGSSVGTVRSRIHHRKEAFKTTSQSPGFGARSIPSTSPGDSTAFNSSGSSGFAIILVTSRMLRPSKKHVISVLATLSSINQLP